jgi:hypothetical protein
MGETFWKRKQENGVQGNQQAILYPLTQNSFFFRAGYPYLSQKQQD